MEKRGKFNTTPENSKEKRRKFNKCHENSS